MAKILPFHRRKPSTREQLGALAQRHSVSEHIEAARARLAAQGIDLPREISIPEPDTSMLDPDVVARIQSNAFRAAMGHPTRPHTHPEPEKEKP